jgi:hypothetical protein
MDMKLVGGAGLIGGTFFLGAVEAAVLKVPQQYTTIQAAVNAAQEGDTVRVAAGTYTERVLISGKAIALVGAGAEQTTIDAAQVSRPITVSNTGAGQVIVAGFTLRNGLVNWDDTITPIGIGLGGGVFMDQTNITLRDNVVTNNLGCLGTGVATREATITMTRNRVENNPATQECGQQAVLIWATLGAESLVVGNVIRNHNTTGLQLHFAGKVTVSNNIFRNNIANSESVAYAGGGVASISTELTLSNNLFSGNFGADAGAAFLTESDNEGAPVRISGNSFVGNATGEFGVSSLWLTSLDAPEDMILKSNKFDESADRLAVYCAVPIVIDASNVFASGRDAALDIGCPRE